MDAITHTAAHANCALQIVQLRFRLDLSKRTPRMDGCFVCCAFRTVNFAGPKPHGPASPARPSFGSPALRLRNIERRAHGGATNADALRLLKKEDWIEPDRSADDDREGLAGHVRGL